MKQENKLLPEQMDQPNFAKLAIATVVGVVILSGAVYAAYRYSQRQSANIILPGGVTYLGPSPKETSPTSTASVSEQPPTAPLRFTTASTVTWDTQSGNIFPYSFSYPSTLPLMVFPGDGSDSVAISWGNIPPQQNILLNIEFIEKRDAGMLKKPKLEYVKNWYKFFSGLKGLAKIEPFTNTNGLKGYKASYVNYANASPNVDVFFEVPGKPDIMIHLANGILDPVIFNRMLDSLKWTATSDKIKPTATP